MAFSTARDIVRGALEDLGVLAAGDTMAAEDAATGLERLNALYDQSAAERLNIFRVTRTTFAITANDETYTIGPTGDITTIPRPMYFTAVNFVDSAPDPDLELPLYPLTDDGYAAITQKAITSPYPQNYYWRPTFPNGTLILWPVPTATTLSLALYTPQASDQLSTLDSSFAMPPGYSRYLRTWLAMELAAPFEREPSKWLIQAWEDARTVVKRSNLPMMDLQIGPGSMIQSGHGLYSILTDQGG